MIDKSRDHLRKSRKPRRTLPAFTPVPRHYNRHDGWTPERQLGFIKALADLGSVRSAAHAVNMTPEGAYLLRRHPEAGEFRKAWQAALALGVQRLEDIAMERALHGIEVPVYSYGKLVGTRRVYNDALLMFLLRNRAPARFAADSLNGQDAATHSQLERLKREWREEWEAETKIKDAAQAKEVIAEINARILKLRGPDPEMSPSLRRYHAAYEAARRAERAGTTLEAMGVDPFAEGFDVEAMEVPSGENE
jgi:hypothetical protein